MNFLKESTLANDRFKDVEYATLDGSETSLPSSTRGRSLFNARTWNILSGAVSTLLLLLAGALIMRILTPSPKTAQQLEDEEWNHCGRSSSLAIERGCVMEPFFYGWMPPRCVFPELSEQYPVFSNRKWYKHENKTVELPEDDLWKGKHKFIYTEKYHGEHCLFQWRKLQYGMQNRKDYLDNKTISGHHANHCADQISIACEAPGDVSKVELGFYRCRKTVW